MAAFLVAALCAAAFASALVPRASAQSTVNVSIQGYAFSPDSITVVIGMNNTVTWTHYDSVPHTVTADDNSWGSGDLATGATFTHTFSVAGTFDYHCSIHHYMTGTVIVKGSGPATTSTTASTTSTASSATTSTNSATTSSSSSTSASSAQSTTSSQTSQSRTTAGSSTSSSSDGGIPELTFQGAIAAADE